MIPQPIPQASEPDFETKLILAEHDVSDLLHADIPDHYAARLADLGAAIMERAHQLEAVR